MNQVDPNTSYLKQHQFGTDRTINDDFPASLPSTGVDSSSRASLRGTPRARPSGLTPPADLPGKAAPYPGPAPYWQPIGIGPLRQEQETTGSNPSTSILLRLPSSAGIYGGAAGRH